MAHRMARGDPRSRDACLVAASKRRDGTRTDAAHYEAVVTVSFNPPNDEATIRLNPSGLYISGCSWTKRLEGQRP